MTQTLPDELLAGTLERLSEANRAFDARYPGESGQRQPVHVLYGGAQRFNAGTVSKLGGLARQTMRTYVEDAETLTRVTGMTPSLAETVHLRILSKLELEPLEDFRIDFEDGYGVHTDDEEDRHAAESALQLAVAMRENSLPPFIGIRIKALTAALHRRAFRTLDLFLTTLLLNAGELPANFVVTLPKVTNAAQVAALDEILSAVESRFDVGPRSIRVEIMIETPQLLIDHRGVCAIPELVTAANGRCRGLHFGPYDYTTAVGIAGSRQSLHHPSCDIARHVMQTAAAGTGLFLSDGPTKAIPKAGDSEAVHRAMRLHYDDVRRSLHHGFYQGWDLHPAQFPMRYAAVYAFFLEGLETAAARVKNFIEAAAQATTMGTVFDDAASVQGLVNFFLQAHSCGAITDVEVQSTGLTVDELRTRSFPAIMRAGRSAQ